ncbi:MAG: hypothetical protein HY215_09210 [Candidatus Rokubacteria bacterium]|nr:hypothetical protein [Candidatus Rokubacteria bacterium]
MPSFHDPGPLFDGGKGRSLRVGRIRALLVMLWFVIGVTAVAYRVVEREAARSTPAASTGGTTRPADEVKTVTGMLKAVDAGRLVVEATGETPKHYSFLLARSTINVGGKEGTTADLKEGDIIRVTYTESEGKLIAETVTARAARPKRWGTWEE